MYKISKSRWTIAVAITSIFVLGVFWMRSTEEWRWPSSSTAQVRDDFWKAETFALERKLDARSPGYGFMLHLRTMYVKDKAFAMAVPSIHTHVAAANVHEQIVNTGVYAPKETNLLADITSHHCHKGPRLVVDVGTNVGYYALIAASQGCKVYAFDGNLEALEYLRMSAALNNLGDSVLRIFPKLVSNESSVKFDGWSSGGRPGAATPSYATNQAMKLDDVVREPILYLKIDAEGGEPWAFRSAHATFKKYAPLYVFWEMTYYLDKTYKRGYLEVLQLLKAYKYSCESSVLGTRIDLPGTPEEFDQFLMKYAAACKPPEQTVCQDEFFCVSPKTSYNPWAPKL